MKWDLRLFGYLSWLVRQQPRTSIPKVVFDDVEMLDCDPGFGTLLFLIFGLGLGLDHRFDQSLNLLRHTLAVLGLFEYVLFRVPVSI